MIEKYESLTDEELADLFRSGERDAFTLIFHKYWAPLVLHANNFLKDEDMAQDIVQDIFAWMIKFPEKWEIRTELKYYLYSAIRLKVLNAIRHEKTKNNYLESLFDQGQASHADADYNLKELAIIIDSEILKMPPKMQEIFNLSRKQHLSHKEIATMLNISEHTVRTQIRRALQLLRNNKDVNTFLSLLACAAIEIYK
jgi:RNA polymerase sigma-70 factor (ECF subfamily)